MSAPPSNPFLTNDDPNSHSFTATPTATDPFAPTPTAHSSLVPESSGFVGTGAMDGGMNMNTNTNSSGFNPMSPAAGINPSHNPSNPTSFHTNTNIHNNMNNNNINNHQSNSSTPSMYQKLTSCISIQTLQPYFDVDTVDVQYRIVSALKYMNRPDYFREAVLYGVMDDSTNSDGGEGNGGGSEGESASANASSSGGNVTGNGGMEGAMRAAGLVSKGPDLYGPVWITLTAVLFLAVTSNTAKYLQTDSLTDFEYDVSHLAHATIVLCTYTFCIPTALYLMIRCLYPSSVGSIFSFASTSSGPPMPVTLLELISLYGYSLVPFLFATIACLIPVVQLEWLFLLGATFCSVLLILRNVAGPLLRGERGRGNVSMEEGAGAGAGAGIGTNSAGENGNVDNKSKVGPMLMTIMICHLVFCFVLKYTFYRHRYTGASGGSGSGGGSDADGATDDDTGSAGNEDNGEI